jgi:hypothetical protein
MLQDFQAQLAIQSSFCVREIRIEDVLQHFLDHGFFLRNHLVYVIVFVDAIRRFIFENQVFDAQKFVKQLERLNLKAKS